MTNNVTLDVLLAFWREFDVYLARIFAAWSIGEDSVYGWRGLSHLETLDLERILKS